MKQVLASTTPFRWVAPLIFTHVPFLQVDARALLGFESTWAEKLGSLLGCRVPKLRAHPRFGLNQWESLS